MCYQKDITVTGLCEKEIVRYDECTGVNFIGRRTDERAFLIEYFIKERHADLFWITKKLRHHIWIWKKSKNLAFWPLKIARSAQKFGRQIFGSKVWPAEVRCKIPPRMFGTKLDGQKFGPKVRLKRLGTKLELEVFAEHWGSVQKAPVLACFPG